MAYEFAISHYYWSFWSDTMAYEFEISHYY